MDALQNALAIRSDLRAKLRQVEGFIENYKAFAAGAVSPVKSKQGKESVRGRPAEAWQEILAVLQGADAPMSRGQIVSSCAERGYQIPGEDPAAYVGIIVYRNKDKIEKDAKGRYQLRTDCALKRLVAAETNVNEQRT